MELTIALNRYDRHVPFFNGTVAAPPQNIMPSFIAFSRVISPKMLRLAAITRFIDAREV